MGQKFILCLLCLQYSCSTIRAQNSAIKLPLKQVLENISKQHNVFFNYIEYDIASINAYQPDSELRLDQKIRNLIVQTDIQIVKNDSQYYAVFKKKEKFCGYVFNQSTQQPIENVILKNSRNEVLATTNSKGFFELSTQSENVLFLSHLNFEQKQLSLEIISGSDCEKIYMVEMQILLDEIVAQNYIAEGIIKKIDGSIVIKPQKMGLLPGLTEPDVFKTLQQIPGVISADESLSNLNVRGGTHDQNLIYWNGIRLFQTSHFFGLISALNPNLSSNVTLFKNGTSAFYGDSVSSVILVSTRADSTEDTKYAIGINMLNADFLANIKPSKNAHLKFSGRRSFTDFLQTPTYNNYAKKTFQNTEITSVLTDSEINTNSFEQFFFYDFTAQYQHKIAKNVDFFVDALLLKNELDLTQQKTEAATTIEKRSFLKQSTIGGNVGFVIQTGSQNKLDINAYVSNYKVNAENQSILFEQKYNQDNEIIDFGFKIHNETTFNDAFKLKIGYQFNEIGIKNIDQVDAPNFFRKSRNVLKTHVLATQLNITSSNRKTKLMIGGRTNYYDELSRILVEPRFQINQKITSSLSAEVLAETKSQTVSQIIDFQTDFLGIEKRRWVVANNSDVPITTSKQVSVGLTFRKNNWLIVIDGYAKKVKSVDSKSQGFQNQFEFLSVSGNYEIFGTELLVQKKIGNFTNWITHSFMNNDYNFTQLAPPVFPHNFEIAHYINGGCAFESKKWQLAVGSRFRTGKPTTTIAIDRAIVLNNQATIVYNNPNANNLQQSFLLNFSGSYTFSSKSSKFLKVGLAVENILDVKYNTNEFFRINTNSFIIEKVNNNNLSRTVNAFARVNF